MYDSAPEHRPSLASKLRLALYSDQEWVPNAVMDRRLVELLGVDRPRVGYLSAVPDPTRVYFERTRAYYEALGVELGDFIDSQTSEPMRVLQRLTERDGIYLSGGNTFSLLHWLRSLGAITLLRDYAKQGGCLIGVSAGAILMTPSVAVASLCGDPREPGQQDDAGLGLLDFHFWPHFQPGAESTPEASSFLRTVATVRACPDGAGVVILGSEIETYGPVREIHAGDG